MEEVAQGFLAGEGGLCLDKLFAEAPSSWLRHCSWSGYATARGSGYATAHGSGYATAHGSGYATAHGSGYATAHGSGLPN